MYNLIKLHKINIDTEIIPTRPVTSIPGTILSLPSIFANYLLHQLTENVSSYVKNSFKLVKDIKRLGTLPPGTKLFTADTISAYTNIDTKHGIYIMKKWLNHLKQKNKLPENFPSLLLIDLLHLIMTHNL